MKAQEDESVPSAEANIKNTADGSNDTAQIKKSDFLKMKRYCQPKSKLVNKCYIMYRKILRKSICVSSSEVDGPRVSLSLWTVSLIL